MARRGILLVLLVALLAVPLAAADPLPCASALAASVEEFIASLRTSGLPAGPAWALEAVAEAAIAAADRGNLRAALWILRALEFRVRVLVRRDRLDPVTGDALISLIEQARAVLVSCTATPPLVVFNCRSGNAENELMWLSPPENHVATTILYRKDRYPRGPNDPAASVLGVFPGSPDAVGRATHQGAVNGDRYYYAAYSDDGSGELSPGRLTFGRPESTDEAFRWAYTAGGTGRPSVGGFFDALATSSSAGFVYGLEVGVDGGRWVQGWKPARVPAPAPVRPIALPLDVPPFGSPVLLVSSLEGRLWALDGQTGATLWISPPLGGALRSSPCGIFRAFGGVDDVVMIGTANRRGRNRFYGLRIVDGTVAWSFDNGGRRNGIGRILKGCAVDYTNGRVYFTSEPRRRGSRDTLWALSLDEGSATKLWSTRVANVNTSVVHRNGVIYVGTETGEVHAVNADDGNAPWAIPYVTGDGPVKEFVFPHRGSDRLTFTTSRQVHLIRDEGSAASSVWTEPVTLIDPNNPIYWGDKILVADTGGRVYDLDANSAQPAVEPFATFGDPTRLARPGLAYLDVRYGLYAVGTNEGVLYALELLQ